MKSPTIKDLINQAREILAESLMTPIIYLAPKDTEGGQRLILWVRAYTKDAQARLRQGKARSPEDDHDFFCKCEVCSTYTPAD